ncbi:MAG: hypothetical protein B7Z06_06715, partial [Flavobacteriales bacterium 32-35-8]|jgi:hypothetical protein
LVSLSLILFIISCSCSLGANLYPFAILMGYVIVKNASNSRIKKEVKLDVTGKIIELRFKTNFTFSSISGYNMAGVVVTF